MRARILDLLSALDAFSIDVIDESSQHAGHALNTLSAESHFRVKIDFGSRSTSKSSLQVHREVYAMLADVMPTIHALSIEIIKHDESN